MAGVGKRETWNGENARYEDTSQQETSYQNVTFRLFLTGEKFPRAITAPSWKTR